MTRKPAIQLGVHLLMTSNAKSHLEVHFDQPIHPFHVSMADNAIDLFPDVRLMIELDVVSDIIDPHPRHRRLGLIMPTLLHDLRMQPNDIVVAIQTLLDGRDPSVLGIIHPGVTEAAIDLLDTRVDTVAEIYGLLGSYASLGV